MKKISLLVLFSIIIFGNTFSQATKSDNQVVIAASKMNVLYSGIDNPIEIAVSGVTYDKLKLVWDNATSKQLSPGSFLVKPTEESGTTKVETFAIDNGKEVSLGTKSFRIKVVPDPVAKIAGKKEGKISVEKLLESPQIDAELENFVFDLKFIVTSFTVSATIGGFQSDLESNSNKLTTEQIEFIKKFRKNTKLYIEDIKAIGPDGKTRRLQTICLRID